MRSDLLAQVVERRRPKEACVGCVRGEEGQSIHLFPKGAKLFLCQVRDKEKLGKQLGPQHDVLLEELGESNRRAFWRWAFPPVRPERLACLSTVGRPLPGWG